MQGHRNSGAIHEHYTSEHDRKPKVEELVENTSIINSESTNNRLKIAEAVSIELQRPTLNIQTKFDLVLPSNRRRAPAEPRTERDQQATQQDAAPSDAVPEEQVPTRPLQSTTRAGGRRALRNVPLRDYRE